MVATPPLRPTSRLSPKFIVDAVPTGEPSSSIDTTVPIPEFDPPPPNPLVLYERPINPLASKVPLLILTFSLSTTPLIEYTEP